jgi:hypothetical protein
MARKITAGAQRELVRALRERYRAGTRDEKARILDEFGSVSGYHRKHAIRVLNSSVNSEHDRSLSRPRLYDEGVRQALIVLWEASDRVCGKRLRPLLPLLVGALERHGHLQLDETIQKKLLGASASTIDRLLHGARRAAGLKRASRAAPAIRKSVPIRTFADWSDPLPGSMEGDLVAHCGPTGAGSFVQTLVLTDIATGWTECVALVVRESTLIVEALERLREVMPFPLLAFDTDNGSEFINEAVLRYCTNNGIELTRSRPYKKNDQAWVEQKNGSVVRRLVGYGRLEGIVAAEALSRLYATSRLFVNFFQPSFKLASRTRVGARVSKRYHSPLTPCARLMASDAVPEEVKARLRNVAETLDPLRLLDEIRAVQRHLAALADGGRPHTPLRRDDDLSRFLSGLATAWRAGEVRPTHAPKPKRQRDWRTREDPFESAWPTVCEWLASEPDQTGRQLFERLQSEQPGVYADCQLRTLQRRLKDWRAQAARMLVFGVHDRAIASAGHSGSIPGGASGSIAS